MASKQNALHTIVNNFHSAKSTMFDAEEMKFYISRIKELSGMSEQALIIRMLWFAYENDTRYEEHRQRLAAEWNTAKVK